MVEWRRFGCAVGLRPPIGEAIIFRTAGGRMVDGHTLVRHVSKL
jgi:hypothetical protein